MLTSCNTKPQRGVTMVLEVSSVPLGRASILAKLEADYNCYFDVTEAEILERIAPTLQLIEKIKQYISGKGF